ncbi:TPA: hypothetical protein K8M77_000294 [Clostridium perfringens]|nr:hypothetical protein [Clostridium perfringens]
MTNLNTNKNFKGVEICLVNLGNTAQFNYYTINTMEDLKEAYMDMKNRFLADEIEVQGISHSTELCENLWDILKASNEYELELERAIEIYEVVDCIEDFKKLLKSESYYIIEADNELNAYIEFLEETGFLVGVPDHIINYIDYEALLRDFEFNNGSVKRLNESQYIIY